MMACIPAVGAWVKITSYFVAIGSILGARPGQGLAKGTVSILGAPVADAPDPLTARGIFSNRLYCGRRGHVVPPGSTCRAIEPRQRYSRCRRYALCSQAGHAGTPTAARPCTCSCPRMASGRVCRPRNALEGRSARELGRSRCEPPVGLGLGLPKRAAGGEEAQAQVAESGAPGGAAPGSRLMDLAEDGGAAQTIGHASRMHISQRQRLPLVSWRRTKRSSSVVRSR